MFAPASSVAIHDELSAGDSSDPEVPTCGQDLHRADVLSQLRCFEGINVLGINEAEVALNYAMNHLRPCL